MEVRTVMADHLDRSMKMVHGFQTITIMSRQIEQTQAVDSARAAPTAVAVD